MTKRRREFLLVGNFYYSCVQFFSPRSAPDEPSLPIFCIIFFGRFFQNFFRSSLSIPRLYTSKGVKTYYVVEKERTKRATRTTTRSLLFVAPLPSWSWSSGRWYPRRQSRRGQRSGRVKITTTRRDTTTTRGFRKKKKKNRFGRRRKTRPRKCSSARSSRATRAWRRAFRSLDRYDTESRRTKERHREEGPQIRGEKKYSGI